MRIVVTKDFVKIRISKGLSLTELANRMHVSSSVVYNMEQFNNVRPATAQKACKALGEPFNNLFIIVED